MYILFVVVLKENQGSCRKESEMFWKKSFVLQWRLQMGRQHLVRIDIYGDIIIFFKIQKIL